PLRFEYLGRLRVLRGVRDEQEAARYRDRAQPVGDALRVVRVGDEVQHAGEQDGERLAQVDQPEVDRLGHDPVRFPHVGLDDAGALFAVENRPALHDGDRIDVDVDHPGVRVRLLGDLVHVADGGNAGADVE